MPAAVVVPAPIAYSDVVPRKLVVGVLPVTVGSPFRVSI